MAIQSLIIKQRMPRIGLIKAGTKATKIVNDRTVSYPSALDHYTVGKSGQDDSDPEVQELKRKFHAIYGEKPRDILIALMSEDRDEVFDVFYKKYGLTTGLVMKGDDTTFSVYDEKTNQWVITPATDDLKKQCKPIGTLSFMVPYLSTGGVFQIRTSGINSIVNIYGCLDMIKTFYRRISMIPLHLVLEPVVTYPVINGKKKKKIVYASKIHADRQEILNAGEKQKEFTSKIYEAFGQVKLEPKVKEISALDAQSPVQPTEEEIKEDLSEFTGEEQEEHAEYQDQSHQGIPDNLYVGNKKVDQDNAEDVAQNVQGHVAKQKNKQGSFAMPMKATLIPFFDALIKQKGLDIDIVVGKCMGRFEKVMGGLNNLTEDESKILHEALHNHVPGSEFTLD